MLNSWNIKVCILMTSNRSRSGLCRVCAALTVGFCLLPTVFADESSVSDNVAFWNRIIHQMELTDVSGDSVEKKALQAEVVGHIQHSPEFLHFLEVTLPFERRDWVRAYILSVILNTRGHRDPKSTYSV